MRIKFEEMVLNVLEKAKVKQHVHWISSTTAVSVTNVSCRSPQVYDSTISWHDCSTVMHVFIICSYDDDDKAMRGDPGCCENVTVYNDISTYRK